MRAVFFGNGPRGVACFDTARKSGIEIITAVAHTTETDFAKHTQKQGVSTYAPPRVNAPDFVAKLRDLQPDLFILAGYNQILRKEIIAIPAQGAINLHGGKLPEYRGTAPINWQIINGEKTGGCCILYVDEGIDTGDILAQEIFEIGPNDTAGDVIEKHMRIFPAMLERVLADLRAGKARPQKQDLSAGAYFTRRYERDSHVNWKELTAEQAHNLIRGMAGPGYPPAFSHRVGATGLEKVQIFESRILGQTIKGIPGRVALKTASGVIVIAKDRGLLITKASVPLTLLKMGDDLT